ncbi:MAG: hypothetical protein LC128_05085 [Chitinophagales bacterium]|nr:hypothetical protein [Chitinophagales bacterium]
MSYVENVKKSIRKHKSKFVIWLSIGILLIMYSLGRIWADEPLFSRHTRDLPPPNNTGGAYYAALKADDNRTPHFILIGIGVFFLFVAIYHIILALKFKGLLKKR